MFEETVPRTTKEDRAKYSQIRKDMFQQDVTLLKYHELTMKKQSEGLSAEEIGIYKELERKVKLIDKYREGNPPYKEPISDYVNVSLDDSNGDKKNTSINLREFNKNPYLSNFVNDCYDMYTYESKEAFFCHREAYDKKCNTQFGYGINPFYMKERDLRSDYNRLSYDNPFDEGYSITAAVQYCNNMFIEEVPDGIVEKHTTESWGERRLIWLNGFVFNDKRYKYGTILNHELIKRMQKQNKAYAKRCNEDYIDALSDVQNIIAKGEDIANNLSEYEYIENICDKKNRKD